MFEIGRKQVLTAVKKVDFGVYFAEEGQKENRVLLPAKEVPEDIKL